jgi:hypothetical protein
MTDKTPIERGTAVYPPLRTPGGYAVPDPRAEGYACGWTDGRRSLAERRDDIARAIAGPDAWVFDVREGVDSRLIENSRADFYAKADAVLALITGSAS